MSAVHLHLILNHLPILGVLFSVLLLGSGLISKNAVLIRAALIALVIASASVVPAFMTGEGAEHSIEEIVPDAEHYIEEHEEMAELALWLTLACGAFALGSLIASQKKDVKKLNWLVLLVGLLAFSTLVGTGYLGGQIRHTEVRSSSSNPVNQ